VGLQSKPLAAHMKHDCIVRADLVTQN
jgi:hypothetical protein